MLKIMEGFLHGSFRADPAAPEAATGWNVKPTQQVHVAYAQTTEYVATTARWWFVPDWHRGDPKDWKATTFNAKIETAFEKPTFRKAWRSGRCIIPALGYYEWTGPKGKKQPWFVSVETNEPLFFFAGLRATTRDGLETCTILTRVAAPDLAELHPRMPVILRFDQVAPWLSCASGDAQDIADLGNGYAGRYRARQVRPFGLRDDGPELIAPFGLGL